MGSELKPVRWMGTSLRDLRSFPRPVRIDIGHALFAAQEGKTDPCPYQKVYPTALTATARAEF